MIIGLYREVLHIDAITEDDCELLIKAGFEYEECDADDSLIWSREADSYDTQIELDNGVIVVSKYTQ